jgi:hypothetical protein
MKRLAIGLVSPSCAAGIRSRSTTAGCSAGLSRRRGGKPVERQRMAMRRSCPQPAGPAVAAGRDTRPGSGEGGEHCANADDTDPQAMTSA